MAQSHEIGFSFGGSNYIGDIGRTNYIYPNQFAGGLVYKYNINPRIVARGTYTYLPIKGNDIDSDNAYRKNQGRSFSNTIHEIAVGIEINYFDYNIANYKTRYTPYLFVEFAAFNYRAPESLTPDNNVLFRSDFSYGIPVGVGFKGQLINNIAISFEIGARYTFTDELDYSTAEISALNFTGNGNDWYVFSGLAIVYTFGKPQCYSGLTK
ncbi:hypothetical protein BSU00_00285 [Tenacibaculum sp. SG-28]|nr:hypothetical protein BSU00_00285 [Tenacibaculum sp. SG-28]